MLCRVCLIEAECPLQIFDTNGEQLNIASILEKHFWFKPIPDDSISTIICRSCWFKVSDFHHFYQTVEQAHEYFAEVKGEAEPLSKETEVVVTIKEEEEIENFWTESNVENEKTEFMTVNPLYEPEMQCKIGEELPIQEVLNENTLDERRFSSESEEIDGDNDRDEDFVMTSEKKKSPVPINRKRKKIRKTKEEKEAEKIEKQARVKKRKQQRQQVSPLDDEIIKKHIPMGCDLCTFVGENFPAMIQHFRSDHSETRPYVMCCGRKLGKRFLLVQHAHKHEDPEYFKCKECLKVFSDGYVLRSHMLANHAPEEELHYQCDECPKRFSRRYLLELHKPSHIPMEERKFQCDKCPHSKPFASEHLLHIHINMRHTKAANVCHVCAKEIRDNQAFEKHVRLHFEDSGPRLKCPRPGCDRWLKDQDNLKQHLRRHNDEGKIFKCDECGKLCKNKRSLSSHHNYAHTNELFTCEECHKSFKKAITLKEHMAQHTGESLYKCPFCPRTFNSNANMHSHKKKMHPKEWDIWRRTKRVSSQIIIGSNNAAVTNTFNAQLELERENALEQETIKMENPMP